MAVRTLPITVRLKPDTTYEGQNHTSGGNHTRGRVTHEGESPREVVQQLQDVREDAHRGHVGAGTGALHDQRRSSVALRRERDHVVAAFGRRHRVIAWN